MSWLRQVSLIQACIEEGNLRDACKLVTAWQLEERFPTLEADYRQRTMQKLLGKGLWGAAAGMAIGNAEFQASCTHSLRHIA